MMLPVSSKPPQDHETTSLIKRTKTPPDLLNLPRSFLSSLSFHPRTSCFIFLLLVIQLICLSYFQHLPPFFFSSETAKASSSLSSDSSLNPVIELDLPFSTETDNKIDNEEDECKYGKFYVYYLPEEFNIKILENCETMSPFGSRCKELSNDGFGPPATGIDNIVPANLRDKWYFTNQFTLEILLHNRLLKHKCRTPEPESAAAFYIPYYGGLQAESILWADIAPKEKDKVGKKMLSWVESTFPYLNRSKGFDHFLSLGRITWDFRRKKDNGSTDDTWGSSLLYQPQMKNVIRLFIERETADSFDIGVPYPTGFHPDTPVDVNLWQKFVMSHKRSNLFTFVGGKRSTVKNDFRGILMDECQSSGEKCRLVDCSAERCANGTTTNEVLGAFLDSEFCLQPRGDSYTRRSVFDCMLAGSIPVFFWKKTAYVQYEWYLPGEPGSYSVFIHHDDVRSGTSIKQVLEKFSKDDVRKMRRKIVEFIPKIIYAKPNEGLGSVKDAIEIAVDEVMRRIKKQKKNWSS